MLHMWLRYVIKSEGFPKFRFSVPTLQCDCMLYYLCNGWTEFDESFTPGVKSPVDFKYGVGIDVWDPQPRQPLSLLPDGSRVNNSQCKVISRSSPEVRARSKMLLSKELYQDHCLWLVNLYEQQDLTSRSEEGCLLQTKCKALLLK